MVVIKELPSGVLVEGTQYREMFRNRFKALMAAHAVALGQAATKGAPVTIVVPESWGDTIVIGPMRSPV